MPGGFRYHTNGGVEPDAWPVKENNLWRFSLANIRVAGMRRENAVDGLQFPGRAIRWGSIIRSCAIITARRCWTRYLDYFKANYTGNRAPLHIGHHFNDYQRGAYREALKTFARSVCGLPEVRCVSYKMLADIHGQAEARTRSPPGRRAISRAREMPAIPIRCVIAGTEPVAGVKPRRIMFGACRKPGSPLCGSCHLPRFPAEHGALARDAPVIAGEFAALADHAMARHHERDRIAPDRGADRA